MRGRTVRTDVATKAILSRLANGFSVAAACRSAKIGRSTFYEWRDSEPEFAELVAEAIEAGTDKLEDSATRQALQGNTTLMMLLLKSRRPDKYKERAEHQLTGKNGGPIQIMPRVDLSNLTDDELEVYAQLTEKAGS